MLLRKNNANFKEAIDNIDWTPVFAVTDTQSAFSYVYNLNINLQEKYFPKIKNENKIQFQKAVAV